eukprot:CAMPEP_0195524662 /NCGR_PEP_ID=MMETSP0794_2-20130614/24608_1 /TAXON_ID=515487 /ORGANISM="Stephanopyxis turris, Strain CCMP 815" /LENGTH=39 /DNA_ID= /DNA_START= /DNA_END= /DNA_ORIENTATION=
MDLGVKNETYGHSALVSWVNNGDKLHKPYKMTCNILIGN